MLFNKRNKTRENNTPEVETAQEAQQPQKKGFFSHLKSGLSKTRANLSEGIASVVLGKKEIDDDLLDEIETLLLTSDVGFEATSELMSDLHKKLARKELNDADAVFNAMREKIVEILKPCEKHLSINGEYKPFTVLMVGVNGSGKTTTIGKLSQQFKNDGHSVMLSAGDTFRAAAIEQLQAWGERHDVPVIAQAPGSDSASVSFDAIQSSQARNIDVLLADTAGRLHTQGNLMEELKKVKRVMQKCIDTAPHETLLVLDASIGQNALAQAEEFHKAIGVTGLVITKLDGTAKGGIVIAIAKKMGLPIRYIGVGEKSEDLRPFDAEEFVGALFDREPRLTGADESAR